MSVIKPSKQPRPIQLDAKRWPYRGTGILIQTIFATSLEECPTHVGSADGYEVLCSYNWRSTIHPSIYVPGAPPTYMPPALATTLPQDHGTYFIDQNAYRSPWSTFEPMFRALSVMQPSCAFDQVDVIVNRNSLRKLLTFVHGSVPDTFRVDLTLVHDTLVITRHERKTRERVWDSVTAGYGHEYERHCTTPAPGMADSTSHHRVIRYRLGLLDCVVRFEVDARTDDSSTTTNAFTMHVETPKSTDDIAEALEGLSITANTVKGRHEGSDHQRHRIEVVQKGSLQYPGSLVELKARKKIPRDKDVLPQLWFGRVNYLAVGLHTNGDLRDVLFENVESRCLEWETRCQSDLRKLEQLLKRLTVITRSTSRRSCVMVCDRGCKPPRLAIYEDLDTQPVLSDQILKQWWTKSDRSYQHENNA
ncbi:hypothetical protein LTR64_005302 [Lithohypha guttulata]|uniref:uncharacterized protein n=1 Tax=Lithohypha guttulata TaxID=1690604 RepID=UPI002DE198F9|nr:hypothetical protein LTR51_002904 [Lithohypha guttulata]